MTVSQNGWPVLTTPPSGTLPQITGRVLPGDVQTVLGYVAAQFAARVEPVDPAGSWGWNDRNIRGSSTQTSNHASGTAIDLNAPKHPQRSQASPWTFTPAQVATIRAILADLGGVVRWGGDYTIGLRDEMHFEINADAAAVSALAARLRAPAPSPHTPVSGDDSPEVLMAFPFMFRGNTDDAVTVALAPGRTFDVSSTDWHDANAHAALVALFGDVQTVGVTSAASIRGALR